MPEQKTVRVRIAVAMTHDGTYLAVGDSGLDNETARECFEKAGLRDYATTYVEVDIIPPQPPQTIEGTVT